MAASIRLGRRCSSGYLSLARGAASGGPQPAGVWASGAPLSGLVGRSLAGRRRSARRWRRSGLGGSGLQAALEGGGSVEAGVGEYGARGARLVLHTARSRAAGRPPGGYAGPARRARSPRSSNAGCCGWRAGIGAGPGDRRGTALHGAAAWRSSSRSTSRTFAVRTKGAGDRTLGEGGRVQGGAAQRARAPGPRGVAQRAEDGGGGRAGAVHRAGRAAVIEAVGRRCRPRPRQGCRRESVRARAAAHVPDADGPAGFGSGARRRARRAPAVETTRRYSLPSDADRLLAVERLQIDY